MSRILIAILLFMPFLQKTYSQSTDYILNEMIDKIRSIKTITFTLSSRERFQDKYIIQKTIFKRSYNPDAIYCKQLVPNANVEVLINDKSPYALVNTNGFPYVNVRLDPFGEKLRFNQHHNIYQAGFVYFGDVISNIRKKYGSSWSDISAFDKNVSIDGNICYKIILIIPNYKIIDYPVQDETTIQKLAIKLNICDYQIIELNPTIKDVFQRIKKGNVIKVPSDYAKTIVLYVDKTLFVPRKIEVYDYKGLFEEYLFEDISINLKFDNEEFSNL